MAEGGVAAGAFGGAFELPSHAKQNLRVDPAVWSTAAMLLGVAP